MILEHLNYRSYLKSELAERVAKNPAYSLRAMARQLGMASSSYCEVLKGKRNFSNETALRVAQSLNLNDADSEYFCLLVQLETARHPSLRESTLKKIQAFRPKHKIHDLSVDNFKAIADWYHLAILEMTYLNNFELTPSNIAKQLGISRIEAETAIERLIRLELMEQDESGKLRKTTDYIQARSDHRNSAMRQFYQQMLSKVSQSLENQTPQDRISGAETLPIDRSRLTEAKVIIERCFTEILNLSKQCQTKTDVYNLSVHFFNLTPERRKKS